VSTSGHPHPTFREAFWFWLKLGFISFGGPAGQIAIMHDEIVERKKWIAEGRFLNALNYCMLLPGPEAQELATYLGWLLHGTWGGLTAGILFILPSAILLWGLSLVFVLYGNVPTLVTLFYGLKIAVLALVSSAVLRIGTRVLKSPILWCIAAASFISLIFFRISFPLVIEGAALTGFVGGWLQPSAFRQQEGDEVLPQKKLIPLPSFYRTGWTFLICITLWLMPPFIIGWSYEDGPILAELGMFFSRAALFTFGGAYAILPYVANQAVEHYHWLTADQMMSGMALAETTPGPLIIVLQFVGFMAGWSKPGIFSPIIAASLGACLTTWCTFAPSFLYVFVGGPYVENLRGHLRLSHVLSSVTAAIVGVVLGLAVWFGKNLLLPNPYTFDFFAGSLALVMFCGIVWKKWNSLAVIAACGILTSVWQLVTTSLA